MKALIQRVSKASVAIAGETRSTIDTGLLVLLGVEKNDNQKIANRLIDKLLTDRGFPDEAGKMNRSVQDINGEILLVSQFTLAADTRSGTRPGFSRAAEPLLAKELYQHAIACLDQRIKLKTGEFGADMQVSLVNDGPVTFMLEVE